MARKTTLIILLFTAAVSSWIWGATSAADDRVRLFEKYDFKSGQFAIVGITWGEQRNKIQDKLGNFACGYHYSIFVLKDGKEVESFFF